MPSVALLHENARDVAHGLLAPERLIVTPHARLVIAEHVLGSAVEQLQYNRERLWQDLRVALPATAGAPRFDHRADVTAVGLVALALVLGRPIATDEYPHRIARAAERGARASAMGEEQPLPAALRGWLVRTLQLDARHGFASATEAQAALEDALRRTRVVAAPVALETFLSRYIAALLEPPCAAPSCAGGAGRAEPVPPAAERLRSSRCLRRSRFPRRRSRPHRRLSPPRPRRRQPAPSARVRSRSAAATSRARLPCPRLRPTSQSCARHSRRVAPDAGRRRRSTPSSTRRSSGGREPASWRALAARGRGRCVLGVPGWYYWSRRAAHKTRQPPTGTLCRPDEPAGVAVFVDGVAHGNTPARISLAAGSHISNFAAAACRASFRSR